MHIVINGEKCDCCPETSVHDLLVNLEKPSEWVAVALNGQFLPKASYTDYLLKPGDHLEILEPAQGG